MRSWILNVVLLCLVLLFDYVSPEAFSSITSLQKLVGSEGLMLHELDSYIKQEEARLENLKSKIRKLRENPLRYVDSSELEYAGHPINAYHVIKAWNSLTDDVHLLPHTNINNLLNHFTSGGITFPSKSDLDGAVSGVIRLQNTYKLTTDDLANGTIHGFQAGKPPDADDFYRFGVEAISSSDTGIGAQWLQKAVDSHNENSNFLLSDALLRLSSAHRMVGDYEEAKKIVTIAYEKFGDNQTVRSNYDDTTRIWNQITQNGQEYNPYHNISTYVKWLPENKKTYQTLCREVIPRDIALTSTLVCRYRVTDIPILRYKEEIHNYDPYISFIYDILTEKQTSLIKNLATPALNRATVGDPSNSERSNERVSKVSWLWDSGRSDITELSKHVGRITGLATTYRYSQSSAEPFQVVNYGIGGQYEPHHDYYEDKAMLTKVPYFIQGTGDRIATFMFYLSQPVAGGATVFPRVGVRVPAIKYGAAFWYNIKRSGELDGRTEHAGCPVLLGQKWVANKWIREYGQEFRRPCGLSPDAVDIE